MAPKCHLDVVEQALSRIFYKLGKCVSRYPLPFLIVPLVVCIGLTGGIVKLTKEDSTEIVYTPTDGEAKTDRRLIQEYFPQNQTHLFQSTRKTDLSGYLQIVFTAVPGSPNIYTPEAFAEIITLDNLIHRETINFTDRQVSYDEICANWKGQCSQNAILEIISRNPANIINMNITYPVHDRSFLGVQLGGVRHDENGYVVYAEAVLLTYHLAYQTEDEKSVADAWMQAFIDKRSRLDNFSYIKPNFDTSLSMNAEIARATGNIIPLFSMAYSILMVFATVSTTMKDWVRCKAWVAMAGEFSAVLAVGASLGFLSLCGVKFTSTVGTMPFLIVGIGIDNMFILLSSWRQTNYLLPVEERMGQAFEKAAVSITLTSLTDALAFAVGSYTSFLSIQLFCAYTGVAVIFCYINTITFFAATMYFSGKREAANRHEYTCMKALPKEAENTSKLQRIFCSGGDSDMEDPQKVKALLNKRETRTDIPFLSNFLGEKYATFLMHIPVRVVVIIIYFTYLGFSVWGCVTLQEGLALRKLAPDDSYLIPYYDNYNRYFLQEYGPYTMVAIHEPIDYSKAEVKQQAFDIIDSFQQSKFFFQDQNLTESWLKDYESYLNVANLKPANMRQFISILRTRFLTRPEFERYIVDLNFSADYSQILGSRFMIQAHGVKNAIQEKELVLEVRRLANNAPYSTTGYHAAFIFYDQYIVVVSNTIRNLILAAASMLLVSLFLLPHPLAILWVTASVLSICFGVVGFMVFWDVNLDSISMINLIMCIGFSVDFSGHICYHYTISEGSPLEKVKESMRYLGLPIWQGAISTLLGVVVLSFSNSYIFRTFFKLIFLVIVFGFFHAMVVLPVVLPTIGPGSCSKDQVKTESQENDAKKEQNYSENDRRKESEPLTHGQKEYGSKIC